VQITQRNVVLSDDDAIGFVRKHGRIGVQVQRSALNADGVRGILDDRAALERMLRKGTIVKVRHLFLLADPRTRTLPGGWRKDLLGFMGRVEKKGAAIKDVDQQLITSEPEQRYEMVTLAMEQLANNGRTLHLAKRRQGRKETVYPPEVETAVEKAWLNTRDYPTEADAEAAIKKIDPTYTKERAWKRYRARYKRIVDELEVQMAAEQLDRAKRRRASAAGRVRRKPKSK
jgi:hypothetical protein